MIVYGDAQYVVRLIDLVADLRGCAACCAVPTLDRLRALLIRAGQLEQAVFDAPTSATLRARAHALTALAGQLFYAAWARANNCAEVFEIDGAASSLARVEQLIDTMPLPDTRVTVYLPEGFAFYALFPDHYCLAAQRWLREQRESVSRYAVIVSVRSIGTTLGAVVAAVLGHAGWHVTSLSVRPTGHPFDRQTDLGDLWIADDVWGLVVDEGPGLSGSSMASVAAALVRAGVRRQRIVFFPGHGGEPGWAALGAVRTWWRATPRYPAAPEALRFDGRLLPEALAEATRRLCDSPIAQVEDFGGGLWRQAVYQDADHWPAVCTPFERSKYRVTLRNGQQVLWKFSGLAGAPGGSSSNAEAEAALLRRRAAQGWGPALLGVAHGFVAMKWIDGEVLHSTDATPELLAHIGRYIADVAAPPLSLDEQQAALARLTEIAYWNVWEAFGQAAAERIHACAEAAWASIAQPLATYGDGRLAPGKWLRLPTGRVLKLDAGGHALDHTAVGSQPVVWDLAGAILEWRLCAQQAAHLLDSYHTVGGQPVAAPLLAFCRLAYAAFRLGQTTLCAQIAPDPAEQARLWRAAALYRAAITDELEQCAAITASAART